MGGLVLKSVDEDVCFHPDYVKRGIQCYDEAKSIVVHIIKISHPASHVTLWLSSGKFASGSDFKGGAFFLKGGAFFVGILPPLIFREMMQKPTPFFLPPLIIFGKKRAPLNNWKHFYCPPEFCPAFWKPPLNLHGDLKPLLVPPWFCFGIFKAPLKVEKQNKCPP